MAEGTFYLNANYKYEIGDDAENLILMGSGLSSAEPASNEEIDQTAYLDGGGFSTSTVIGGQITYAFSGHREHGDPAQDYIFAKKYQFGDGRKCYFKITDPVGEVVEGPATLAVVTPAAGEANAKGEVSIEIHFNGLPTVTPPPTPTQ